MSDWLCKVLSALTLPSSPIKSHNSPFFLIFVQNNKNDSAPLKIAPKAVCKAKPATISNSNMKLKITVCIIVLVFFSGCMFFNPEKKYTPENAAGYYFPPISEELIPKGNIL